MGELKQKFVRYEKKYLLGEEQYRAVRSAVEGMVEPDKFGESRICNIYYDTPDWRIIRLSLDKPVYKEKLRLRCYGEPDDNSRAFIEIKKKYKGVVYKRRVAATYRAAYDYLTDNAPPPLDSQIMREIDYFKNYYPDLAPAMALSYNRTAFFGRDNSDFRITFDRDIAWRAENADLAFGSSGRDLLGEGNYLMEIKIPGAMPLWMVRILDDNKIFPVSFSKYGAAYLDMISSPADTTGPRADEAPGGNASAAVEPRGEIHTKNTKKGEISA